MRNKNKLQEAIAFAKKAHDGQMRDDGRPYIIHPMAVMNLLEKVTDDQDILCAAVLHDVVEDCGVSVEEIDAEFGKRVAHIVEEVSKNKTHPINIKSREAYLIKMADKLHNITDIAQFFFKGNGDGTMAKKKKRSFADDMESNGDPSEWKKF